MTSDQHADASPGTEHGSAVNETAAFTAFIGVAGVATLCMVAFIVVYGRYGEWFTAALDEACAEAAFDAGKQIEMRGNRDQALQYYAQALQGRFRSRETEYLCRRSMGEILMRQGRYSEAVEVFRAMPEAAYVEAGSLTAYVSALWRSRDFAETERLGLIWLAKAQEQSQSQQALWANAALGQLYMATERPREALAYFQEASKIELASDASLHAARLLHAQGDNAEAIQLLDAFLALVHSGPLHENALALRAQFTAPAL